MNSINQPQNTRSNVPLSNEPNANFDTQKFAKDIATLYVEVGKLKEDAEKALNKAESALGKATWMEPILLLGFLIVAVTLVAIIFAAFPVYETYFRNSYIYQTEIPTQESKSTERLYNLEKNYQDLKTNNKYLK